MTLNGTWIRKLRLISLLEKEDMSGRFEKLVSTLSISNPVRMYLLFSSVAYGAKKLSRKEMFLAEFLANFGETVLHMKLENE